MAATTLSVARPSTEIVTVDPRPATADPLFTERWSTRAFSSEPVSDEELATLLDAARHAPSSNNEQPWLVLYATTPEDRERFASILVEGNRVWARHAPVLAFLVARTHSAQDVHNPYAAFDSGAAWMSLALQARLLGLFTHAMAGFDRERAHEALGVPRHEYEILIALAIGRRGDPAALPPHLAAREKPSTRKPIGEMSIEGGFLR